MSEIAKNIHQSHSRETIDSTHPVSPISAMQNHSEQPIWEVIVEIGSQIPDEEWAKVPDDASINLKHYLYGCTEKNV